MKEILVAPQVDCFSTFCDFAKEFGIGKDDLILTGKKHYDIMEKENLSCHYIFRENYGKGEPTDSMVDAILQEMNKISCKRIIAVGGGSVIDIAKILAVRNATNVDQLFELPALQKEKTLIIVPTTCGTGSEMTNISIINRTRKKTKMGLSSEAMYADHAVLIPEFMRSMPYYVFATSSIDALIHAVESYLNPYSTPYTEMFSLEAVSIILKGYAAIAQNGREARFINNLDYLRAANYAGIAFGNNGCGAVHAMSYALGARYHVPHGESNYQFFTDILKKYCEKEPEGKIKKLSCYMEDVMEKAGFPDKGEVNGGIERLEILLTNILERKRMRDYGVTQEDIDEFTQSTINEQQRLLKNNYVALTAEEIREIYQNRL